MRVFGLAGYPLTHSFSPKLFEDIFEREKISDCAYSLFPCPIVEDIFSLIKGNKDLCGINITIPHKKSILPFLDEVDETAKQIGAVNTVTIKREGDHTLLKGFNSDIIGFEKAIKPFLKTWHSDALIFGTGGASVAASFVLKKLGINWLEVSRNPVLQNQINYVDVNVGLLQKYTLLVNATPVGMFPNTNSYLPISFDGLSEKHLFFDMVYNPEMTFNMELAHAQGATVVNGMEMLRLQAEEAWRIFGAES